MDKTVCDGFVRFSGETGPISEPGLVWYYFIFYREDGTAFYYGNNPECLGGEGSVYDQAPPSFQITVYAYKKVPDWYKNSVVYQIFPDRFYRGEDFSRRMADKFDGEPVRGPKRVLQMDWDDDVYYDRDELNRIRRWTFFGGTLAGIREKLAYLKNLGVGAIYLNPIFEAASNHRYDTGDYLKIDKALGDEESFSQLCQAAKEMGISIILDGVFNHTGCDSKYFNKYGNYENPGAYQGEGSDYYKWYRFYNFPEEYESWWGVGDLPNVEENEPSFQSFIYGGRDSVIRRWMRLGAKGWRLDVADELPDSFIQGIQAAVSAEDPDGLLIGEVWEDASNKISYGERRRYLLGDELDGTMNYPFRDNVLAFLLGERSAGETCRYFMSLYENYPPESFYGALNLLGSHDRMRVLTVLGDAPAEGALSEKERGAFRLSPEKRALAIARLRCALLLQMTFPGVPCIYYGDEAGLEGYADPYNRGTFPWGREDGELMAVFHQFTAIRNGYDVLKQGDFAPFNVGDDVFGFRRSLDGEEMVTLVNRSVDRGAVVELETCGRVCVDVLSARPLAEGQETVKIDLPPLGCAAVYFKPQKLQVKRPGRGAGILCHVTSVPSPWGAGQMGRDARDFVDFLAAAGQKYWQILPLNPTDKHDSPYAGPSAFAGNWALIAPEELVSEGLLRKEEVARGRLAAGESGDFKTIAAEKRKLLKRAYSRFKPDGAYKAFCEENQYWLDSYCLFMAEKEQAPAKKETGGTGTKGEIQRAADFHRFLQYVFARQWTDVKKYANDHGISIIGDIPMYVSEESADVRAHPALFQLDSAGRKKQCAGVPPDYFSEDGQLWGNPLYDWDAMKNEGYDWWIRRIRLAMERYDYIRLDHFRGFEAYWSVPAGKKASEGYWQKGPGQALFDALGEKLGTLPVIAEDLGEITPQVRSLMGVCGFPGMDIFQFSDGDKLGPVYYADPDRILYTGTHDNQTLVGWCAANADGADPRAAAESIVEKLYRSDAKTVILPLQDALLLGDETRMNTPGTLVGNWHWSAGKEQLSREQAEKLKALIAYTNR